MIDSLGYRSSTASLLGKSKNGVVRRATRSWQASRGNQRNFSNSWCFWRRKMPENVYRTIFTRIQVAAGAAFLEAFEVFDGDQEKVEQIAFRALREARDEYARRKAAPETRSPVWKILSEHK